MDHLPAYHKIMRYKYLQKVQLTTNKFLRATQCDIVCYSECTALYHPVTSFKKRESSQCTCTGHQNKQTGHPFQFYHSKMCAHSVVMYER